MGKLTRREKLDAIRRIVTGKTTPVQEFGIEDEKPCKVIMQVSDETNTQLLYQDEDKVFLTVDEVKKLRDDYSLLIFQIMTNENKHLFEPHFHIARTGALPPPIWVKTANN